MKFMRKTIGEHRVHIRRVAVLAVITLAALFGFTYTAHAYTVSTTTSTSYFSEYNGSAWTAQLTPYHTTSGGNVAYCLAEKKTSPAGNSYNTGNIMDTYSERVRRGLQIILETGYPMGPVPGGLSAAQARYATANAIRFWLAENGDPNFYNNENFGSYSDAQLRSMTAAGTYGAIGSKMRASSTANKPVLQYAIELLIAARAQALVNPVVSFSPLSMSFNGSSFVGTTTVSLTNIKYGYTLDTSGLPAGSNVSGYTGSNGDVLTVSIPANYDTSGNGFTLSGTGYDDVTTVNLFAIAPTSTSYQSVAYVQQGAPYKAQVANGAVGVYTPAVPDLVMTSVTTDKFWYNAGETITVTATVQNQSKGWVDFSYTQLMGIQDQYNGAKNPWDAQTFTYQITAPTLTQDTAMGAQVTTDVYNYRQELNESNNSGIAWYNVRAGLPDLTVTSLTTDKAIYNPGDTVNVTAVIANTGYTAANNFAARLTSSPSVTTQDKTISVGAGGSTTVNYSYTAPSGYGSMTITETADATGIIGEMNESNNSRNATVQLNQPPTVALSVSKNRPNVNQAFNITATPTDPEGFALDTTITSQYMGMDNATPGAVNTVFTGSKASGSPASLTGCTLATRGYYRITAKAVDNYGLSDTKTVTIYVNGPPTVDVVCTPEVVSDDVGEADIKVTPDDEDGDNLDLVVTIQPIGMDKITPGEVTTIYDGNRAHGSAATIHRTGLTPGYYKVIATVTDPGSLTATKTLVFLVEITNVPPEVTLSADKPSYVEGDDAIITIRAYDRKGDQLDLTVTYQDMGELGMNPQPPVTEYHQVVASGTKLNYTRNYMIPHPIKITATAVDPGGLSDTKSITLMTIPAPIKGVVTHTDLWEQHRLDYNAWAIKNSKPELVRPPELFFRDEKFIIKATTSHYLTSQYVHVRIREYPQYEATLTSTDGYNWTGEIAIKGMRYWQPQSLTFDFDNLYVDGTVTTDTVVVRIDKVNYWTLRMLF
jgi:hypothetical protein